MPRIKARLHNHDRKAAPWEIALASGLMQESTFSPSDKITSIRSKLSFVPCNWRAESSASIPDVRLALSLSITGPNRLKPGGSITFKRLLLRSAIGGLVPRDCEIYSDQKCISLICSENVMKQSDQGDIEVSFAVELGSVTLSLSQFLSLRAGSVMIFDRPDPFPVLLRFDGCKIAEAVAEFVDNEVRLTVGSTVCD